MLTQHEGTLVHKFWWSFYLCL